MAGQDHIAGRFSVLVRLTRKADRARGADRASRRRKIPFDPAFTGAATGVVGFLRPEGDFSPDIADIADIADKSMIPGLFALFVP